MTYFNIPFSMSCSISTFANPLKHGLRLIVCGFFSSESACSGDLNLCSVFTNVFCFFLGGCPHLHGMSTFDTYSYFFFSFLSVFNARHLRNFLSTSTKKNEYIIMIDHVVCSAIDEIHSTYLNKCTSSKKSCEPNQINSQLLESKYTQDKEELDKDFGDQSNAHVTCDLLKPLVEYIEKNDLHTYCPCDANRSKPIQATGNYALVEYNTTPSRCSRAGFATQKD